MPTANNIAVIILAAGDSSRLGLPKQLLEYGGKNLLQHTIDAALNSIASPVLVVLGANEEQIKKTVKNSGAQIVVNQDWKEGMASSVRAGIIEMLRTAPGTPAAIIMLCDQPYISAALINDLVAAYENTGKKIVASSYGGTLGAPTFFHKDLFQELLQLNGDVGAKSIIRQHREEVEAVFFLKGEIDIDTIADYDLLTQSEPNCNKKK